MLILWIPQTTPYFGPPPISDLYSTYFRFISDLFQNYFRFISDLCSIYFRLIAKLFPIYFRVISDLFVRYAVLRTARGWSEIGGGMRHQPPPRGRIKGVSD